ncbi:hypothetical protein OIU78_004994 [Salix suchowensis]|nr:hypothetical protein OIU78_004994 [Salix suchowensis]
MLAEYASCSCLIILKYNKNREFSDLWRDWNFSSVVCMLCRVITLNF